jgi:hypothetical protein
MRFINNRQPEARVFGRMADRRDLRTLDAGRRQARGRNRDDLRQTASDP